LNVAFWESVFNDFLGVFILVTVGLYVYSKMKGVSMKDLFDDLKETFK